MNTRAMTEKDTRKETHSPCLLVFFVRRPVSNLDGRTVTKPFLQPPLDPSPFSSSYIFTQLLLSRDREKELFRADEDRVCARHPSLPMCPPI
jgi:hypothetical protein